MGLGGVAVLQQRSEFVIVPNWVHGLVSPGWVGVYAGLRTFDVPGGECGPTEREVAHLLGVSVSTIKRGVRDLRAVDAIRLHGQRRGGRNAYMFPARKGQSFSKVPVALLGQIPIRTVGVYSVLRGFDGPSGCYPCITTVAERARLGHTATQDALRALRGIGAIEVAPRYKPGGAPTSNLYCFPDMVRLTPGPVESDPEGAVAEHEWDHQPGVTGVMGRVPVGAAGGHELERLTRDSEPEMVGKRPPPAVGQELIRKPRTTAKSPGQTEADYAADRVIGPSRNMTPATPADGVSIGTDWFHHPLTDPTQERWVWKLVDLLAQQLALSGSNKPSEATREAWARTARVMLVHDKRDSAKVWEVICNACADISWSNAIKNMYDIARYWDRLVATFDKRAPKRFKPKTDKLVAEDGSPPVDFSRISLGVTNLADL
jgi:hypothetical protein